MSKDKSASILSQTIAAEKRNRETAAIFLRDPGKYAGVQFEWARLVVRNQELGLNENNVSK